MTASINMLDMFQNLILINLFSKRKKKIKKMLWHCNRSWSLSNANSCVEESILMVNSKKLKNAQVRSVKYEDWLVDGKVLFPPRKPHTKARLFIKAASDDSSVCFNCFPSKGNEISPIEWFWRKNHIEDSLEDVSFNQPSSLLFPGKTRGEYTYLIKCMHGTV